MKKNDFLKDFWGKEKVEVEADVLKENLQLIKRQEEEIKRLTIENNQLKAQVVYYRDKFMALDAKQPLFIDLMG